MFFSYIANIKYIISTGLKIADVGCGAGFLSEALARAGANVVGVDMAEG